MSRLAWVLLLCVTIDFSDPLLPGAVRLDPAESIQAVYTRSVASRSLAAAPLLQALGHYDPPRSTATIPSAVARLATVEWRPPPVGRVVRHHPDDRSIPAAEDH
jgi:hypothetical protein